jgi:DNA invertase Pin-like site-specific DNA recombinase
MIEASASTAVALFLRVSTEDQDLSGQERELREYCRFRGWVVVSVYAERISGAGKIDRKEYDSLLAVAREPSRPWSRVVVWSLDRFSRDETFTKATQAILDLEAAGVRFCSLKEPTLETPEDGKPNLGRDVLLALLPVIAAFESKRRSERVRVAMKELKAGRRRTRSGRPVGRPARLSAEIVRSVVAMRRRDPPVPYSEIAQRLRIPTGTARRAFSLASRGLPAFVSGPVQNGSTDGEARERSVGTPSEQSGGSL